MITKDYGTSDIVLAATLKMHGVEFDRISVTKLPSGMRRGVFHFKNVSVDDLTAFDMGKFSVEPVAFNSEVRQLTAAVKRLTESR